MKTDEIYKLPLASAALSAYLLDESLLVYSKNTQNVYGFEKEGAALFLKIDEMVKSRTPEEIAEAFPGVDPAVLKEMVELASGREELDVVEYEADIEPGRYVPDEKTRFWYVTESIAYGVHYPDEAFARRIHPVFLHLHTPAEPRHLRNKVAVDFQEAPEGWVIYWNGKPVQMEVPQPQMATFLQEKMMTGAYQARKYLIALHAGAVEREGRVIVMPATAESGKTTLIATLVARGFSLFSDEVAALDYEGCVQPLPFCMNIKEGSWKVLEKEYPELGGRDVHKRFDGQSIRFLPPKNMHAGPRKASHLLFPTYRPGAKTALRPLSAKEALARIKEASYQVQYNMDERKFEKILANLVALPKYELMFSDRDEAVRAIDEMIRLEE
ncbi:hypothetical protein [Hydrogenimonas urashimensis]|uniref:hypothetical protein n=1 Tax=Hydrogenimonas urashimensis TaxID=2740515 RepID=UPI001915DDF9|nr:hypothetical protein [Hydrogenimonas urashimensis]